MSTSSTNPEYSIVPDNFWTQTQDFKVSARLHLQHWLFQSTIGYVLHPKIVEGLKTKNDGVIRIADVACGNCVWLNELSHSLASLTKAKVELVGFDIQPSFFPATDFIPSDIALKSHDILTETPPEDVEAFDVVHIRAFTSVIKNNDTSPLLRSLLRMVKPGGWIQWEEAPQDEMIAMAPKSRGVSKDKMDAFLIYLREGAKMAGIPFDWVATVGDDLKAQGLQDSAVDKHPLKPDQYKAWTEDYLISWQSIPDMLPSNQQAPNSPATKEKFLAVFAPAVDETAKGVVVHSQNLIVATGRKPG